MSKVEAFIFDVFGTVVDWRSSVARFSSSVFLEKQITIDGLAFADYWRGQYQPAMQRIRSGNRGYVSLDQLHYENLGATLEAFDLQDTLTSIEKWHLNTAWEHLDPWPDVVAGLTALKKTAIIAPCSNGSIALMTRLARYGGLPWDCILGADIARNYKPEREVYQACCSALRLEPDQVAMVAAHNDDLVAARDAGLKTAFIARPTEYGENQDRDLQASEAWDWVINNFSELSSSSAK